MPASGAAATGFPLDDAWIHLVYGRSIATSLVPRYNESAEAGFTSVTWMLVCAIAHWLSWATGLNIGVSLKLLGIMTGAAMSIGVFEVVVALSSARLAATAAAIMCGATPLLAFSQVSGMEVCLAGACGLWAVVAIEREKWLSAGVLISLAFWTRPEFILLGMIVGMAAPIVWRGAVFCERRPALRRLSIPLGVAGLLWAGYCLLTTGHPLPNTFYVKFSTAHPAESLVSIVREILWPMPSNWLGAGAVLAAIGAAQLTRRPRFAGLVVLAFPLIFTLATAVSRDIPRGAGGADGGFAPLLQAYTHGMPEVRGGYFYWTRYAAPIIPFLFVWLGIGTSRLIPGQATHAGIPASKTASAGRGRLALAALGALLVLMAAWTYPRRLAERRMDFAWNCDNINASQVAIGHWVNNNVAPQKAVCVNDAGAIRYFGRRRTIDLVGLNAHELAFDRPALHRMRSDAAAMHDFAKSRDVAYLIVFPSWFAQLLDSPEVEARFGLVRVFRVDRYTISPGEQAVTIVLSPR
ncbi:MAG: hypothetical protein JNG88_05650 [Phycisphaerales bacterium]|nr:hypothetical protein [Phycisphaerales bacterium]